MAASNRAARLTKLVSQLKKHFKAEPINERPLFESLLYATLLENSTHDAANKAMASLEKTYFDWNEVRVSTRAELTEHLKPLNDPVESADRLKRTLQSVFESIYAFDMEVMKKQNLGQSVKQITAYDGVTPFAVAFVTQNGLSGHAIAVNSGVLLSMRVMDIITDAEHKKGQVPGLERAVPKNKAREAGALLHLMGVEVSRSPYGPAARKLLLALDPSCKDRLPKRPKPKPPEPPKKEPAKKEPAKKKAAAKPEAKTKAAKTAKTAEPAAKGKKKAAPVKSAPKKPAAKKPAAKKAPAKKTPAKKKAKAAPVKKKPAAKTAKKKAKKAPAKPVKKPAKKKAKTAAKKRKPK